MISVQEVESVIKECNIHTASLAEVADIVSFVKTNCLNHVFWDKNIVTKTKNRTSLLTVSADAYSLCDCNCCGGMWMTFLVGDSGNFNSISKIFICPSYPLCNCKGIDRMVCYGTFKRSDF